MASNLLELTADIVSSHVSMTDMSADDLLREIKQVYATLDELEKGGVQALDKESRKRSRSAQGSAEANAVEKPAAPQAPAMSIEEAFKPDQVACMICGKTGLKTLKRHLGTAHNLKPGQYRKQFSIPKNQPLAAVEYIEKRRQAALDRGLGDNLVKARTARKAKQIGE